MRRGPEAYSDAPGQRFADLPDWHILAALAQCRSALVRNLRVDLLGETPAGDLVQIEFQSRNERHLPLRMAEYLFSIGALHGRIPRQIVLYVGDEPMRMKDRIEGPDYSTASGSWPAIV
jgi:hypothetical protein